MSNIQGIQSTQSSIITQLQASGDPGAELAAMAVQSGETQRKGANEARDAYERAEASEDQQEVDAMRQKADDIRSEAWIEGAGMVLQGGLELGGSCEALDTLSNVPSSSVGPTDQPRVQVMLATANAETGAFRGAGGVANGVATVMAAGSKAAQANDDASAAQHRGNADLAKAAADDMHDASKDAGDFVKAALDFYNGYVSSEAQTRAAALHRA
jgi:hypothetical protein